MGGHATLPLWRDADDAQRATRLHGLVMDLYRITLADARARVAAMLRAHACADEKEQHDVARILEMLDTHPNLLSANCEEAHITGSALVVHPPSRRVLLNHHKKFDRWMQFGGHPEDETEPWRVALREAREESGLQHLVFVPQQAQPVCFDVDVHDIPARGDRPAHQHLDLRYLLATDTPDDAGATEESNDVRWFTLAELAALDLDPGVRRMLHKAGQVLGWQ